jgi:hypothetical protein
MQTARRAAPLINGSKNGHVCYSTSVRRRFSSLAHAKTLYLSLFVNDSPGGTFAAQEGFSFAYSVTTSVQLSSDSLFAKSDGRPLATHQRQHLTRRRLLSSATALAQSRRRIVFAFSAAPVDCSLLLLLLLQAPRSMRDHVSNVSV